MRVYQAIDPSLCQYAHCSKLVGEGGVVHPYIFLVRARQATKSKIKVANTGEGN